MVPGLIHRVAAAGSAQAQADAAVLEGGPDIANRNLDALVAVTAAAVQRMLRK